MFGVPGECRLEIHSVVVPDLKRSADAAPVTTPLTGERAFLPEPRFRGRLDLAVQRLSSVHMSRSRWWSRLACAPSHDGAALAVFLGPQPGPDPNQPQVDLVELRRAGRKVAFAAEFTSIRELRWSTDSRWLAYWAKHQGKLRLLAVDTLELAGVPEPLVLYDPPEGEVPFAHEWTPGGEGLSVVVRLYEGAEGYSAVYFVPFARGRAGDPRQVLRMRGHLDWESLPSSRFEDGDGPSREPWQRAYGTFDGVYLSDPLGTSRQRVVGMPAVGLQNIEWNPAANRRQLALYFARTAHGETGEVYKGLHLLDLGQDPPRKVQLHATSDVHTVWYSPRGTYVTWASPEGVFLADSADPTRFLAIGPPEPEAARSTKRTRRRRPGQGFTEPPGITGCYWDAQEARLAFTANERLYVYLVATGDVWELTRLVTHNPGFAGDPHWIGDTVLFTYFEDIAYERLLIRNRPKFDLPLQGGCDQLKKKP